MTLSRRARIGLGLGALFLLAVFVFHSLWFTWLGTFLVRDDGPGKADIIVVLGGDFRGTRILKAAQLAWQGYAPLVLVSGAGEVYGQHESDLAVAWAIAHGYRADLFAKFKFPAQSTREEAHAVTAELRKRHVHRFLVVTSNFHTRRAGEVFKSEAPEIPFRVISSPDRYFVADGWWKSREGRKTLFDEWAKTLANYAGI